MLKVKNYGIWAGLVSLACLMILAMLPVSQAEAKPPAFQLQPFQLTFSKTFSESETFTRLNLSEFPVPTGKRLVLEFFSVVAQVPTHEAVVLIIETSVNGTVAEHFVNLAKFWEATYPEPPHQEIGSKLVRIYADPKTTVRIKAIRYSPNFDGAIPGTLIFEGSISGHLEAP
jgi:hypothetical protein